MTDKQLTGEEAKKQSIDQLFAALSSTPSGLSSSDAQQRLQKYGANEIAEKKVSPLTKFLRYFWAQFHG